MKAVSYQDKGTMLSSINSDGRIGWKRQTRRRKKNLNILGDGKGKSESWGEGWLRRTRLPFFSCASGKRPRTRVAGNGRKSGREARRGSTVHTEARWGAEGPEQGPSLRRAANSKEASVLGAETGGRLGGDEFRGSRRSAQTGPCRPLRADWDVAEGSTSMPMIPYQSLLRIRPCVHCFTYIIGNVQTGLTRYVFLSNFTDEENATCSSCAL